MRSGCKTEICEGSWRRDEEQRATESVGEHDVEMHGGPEEEIIEVGWNDDKQGEQ